VSYLNKTGKVPAPNGGKWGIQTICTILSNPKLAGYYCYGRRSVGKIHTLDGSVIPKQRKENEKGVRVINENFHQEYSPELVEPIIDQETWHRTQLLLLDTARSRYPRTGKKRLFKSKIRCQCGRLLTGRTSNGESKYVCPRGKSGGCTGAEYNEIEFIESVLALAEQLNEESNLPILTAKHNQELDSSLPDENHLKALERRYATGLERLQDLDNLLPENFTANLRNIKREIDQLRNQLTGGLESSPEDQIQDVLQLYKNKCLGLSGRQLVEQMINLGIVEEIELDLCYQRRQIRIMTATKSHLISYGNGKCSKGSTTVNPYRNSPTYFRVKKQLPRYFRSSSPIENDINKV
jgi:hypothetical protein